MGRRRKQGWRGLATGERGIVATEFVLIAPIMLALFFGIVDFGHAFFMKQMVTNAAREGARYGVVYADPKHTVEQIQTVVNNYLEGVAMAPASPAEVTGAEGATGTPLTVTVHATKTWWITGWLTGQSSAEIYGTSTMNNE